MLRWSFVCCCYLLVLTSLTTIVHADVDFVAPAAGNDIAVGGPINVQWKDSGIAPSIAELTQYTLALYVGGNEDGNMVRTSMAWSRRTGLEALDAVGMN